MIFLIGGICGFVALVIALLAWREARRARGYARAAEAAETRTRVAAARAVAAANRAESVRLDGERRRAYGIG
jgi:Flp pilus assembly protein TadB